MNMTPCFAYGSNLDSVQLKERCPRAVAIGRASARGYRLAFTRYSKKRGGGVADIILEENKIVWGAVIDLDDHDLAAMDKAEGYNPVTDLGAYLRRNVTVWMDGVETNARTVQTYWVSSRSPHNIPPAEAYLHQIITGARAWGLPAEYVSELMRIPIVKPPQL